MNVLEHICAGLLTLLRGSPGIRSCSAAAPLGMTMHPPRRVGAVLSVQFGVTPELDALVAVARPAVGILVVFDLDDFEPVQVVFDLWALVFVSVGFDVILALGERSDELRVV